jgi:hypothetical protein
MLSVPIQNLVRPRRASTIGFAYPGSDQLDRVEFYSGIIGINFRGGGGSVHREDFQSFLPIDSRFAVMTYEPETEINTTVLCTPNAVAGDDDEANVAAVDNAGVRLKPQSFAGIGGQPLCLVLTFRAAALNTTLPLVSYHVTVIHRVPIGSETGDGERIELSGDDRPA